MRDEDYHYIKSQKFNEILNRKEKFVDDFFPPSITSLVPANKSDPVVLKTPQKYVRDYLTYMFKRPGEIYGENNYCIFSKSSEIGTQDIIQGSMASCYLIVTLANMARNPNRIYDLYITKEVNETGVYGMRIYVQGEPTTVLVDDYFPSKDNNYTFSLTYKKENEMWVQICEKVWGKVNQSCYLRTFLGTPQEALYFLNPAPAYYVHHKNHISYPDPIWELLKTSLEKNYIICTNTEDIDEENENSNGLFKFHAYGILDLIETNGIKLIKLRNPWGDKIWKGKYGNINGKEWNDKMRKEANASDLRSGSFYMEFCEYIKYFPWSFYSKVIDSWSYRCLKYEVSVDVGDHSEIQRTLVDNSIKQSVANSNKNIYNINNNKPVIQVGINNNDPMKTNNNSQFNPKQDNKGSDIPYYNNQLNPQDNYTIVVNNEIKKEKESKKSLNELNVLKNNNTKNSKHILKGSNLNLLDDNKNNNKINTKDNNNYSPKKPEIIYSKEKKNYDHQETLTNLRELENYKIKAEILKHGDYKILDIIDRNTAAAFIRIEKPTKACITFHQPQKRFIKDAQDTFEVSCGVIFIFKYQLLDEGDSYLKIESAFEANKRKSNKREKESNSNTNGKYYLVSSLYHNFEKLYIEHDFENIGEYHILCISQFENFDLKFNLVISTYAEIPLELYFLNRKDIVKNWLLLCLKELAIKNACYSYFDESESSSFFINYLTNKSNTTGFGLLYYENNSPDTMLKVKIALNNSESFRVLNCQKLVNTNLEGMNCYTMNVKKESYKFLLIQFTQAMPLVSIQARHEIYFDYSKERIIKNFIKEKSTKRISLYDNLYLFIIRYDRGFVFYCSNNNKSNNSFLITINLRNLSQKYKIIDEKEFFSENLRSHNIKDNIVINDFDSDFDSEEQVRQNEDFIEEIEEIVHSKKKDKKENRNKDKQHSPQYRKKILLENGKKLILQIKCLYGILSENEELDYNYECKLYRKGEVVIY